MIPRGSVALAALPGDYGKPRPVLVVQSDISADLPSVIVCPLTTTIRPELPQFRLTITPSATNGLRVLSQVMIEKPLAVPRDKLRAVIGHLDDTEMRIVTNGLSVLLAIA